VHPVDADEQNVAAPRVIIVVGVRMHDRDCRQGQPER
jgi:hypothetical protein